jgi:hypothetical protein
VGGLREVARRINVLDPGMYRILHNLSESSPTFLAGTKYIIERLYGGDENAALEAADAQLGIRR